MLGPCSMRIKFVKLGWVIFVISSFYTPTACDADTDERGFPAPRVNEDDGRRLLWKPAPGERQCYYPDFSPDGSKLACRYSFGFAPEGRLIILDVNTLEISHIVPEDYEVSRPDWSPTGEWIAFQGKATGSAARAIWICRPDGSDLHQVSGDWAYLPFWNADGSRVYYVGEPKGERSLGIMYYDLTTEKNTVVRGGDYKDWQYNDVVPSRAANSWLAASMFISLERERTIKLMLGPYAGDVFKIILGEEDKNNGYVVDWSPDDSHILFTYEIPFVTPMCLWSYELKSGIIRQITVKPPEVAVQTITDGSWGPAGEIAFATHNDDLYRCGWIYLIDAPK